MRAVMMPFRFTSNMSQEDAAKQAANLGVRYDVIPIAQMYDASVAQLTSVFEGFEEDATEENIQARCRGLLLMAISNKTGCMLLTTGNKSEMAVGYATLYGDMAGGFAPIPSGFGSTVASAMLFTETLGINPNPLRENGSIYPNTALHARGHTTRTDRDREPCAFITTATPT